MSTLHSLQRISRITSRALRPSVSPILTHTYAIDSYSPPQPKITALPHGLEILGPSPHRSELPYLWLRDNCRCSQCINPATHQRAFNTFDIPAAIKPQSVGSIVDGKVKVVWEGGHESVYDWDFLDFWLKNDKRTEEDIDMVYWGAEIADEPPTMRYEEIMESEEAVGKMSHLIRRYGLVLIEGTPHPDPAPTEALLRRLTFIRETHYGAFYDFTPNLAHADTAYTNLPLPAHTDTTYFSDPAGLQSFHILSHTNGTGGASLLVDGFNAVKVLEQEDPAVLDVLAGIRVPWHASGNEGITIAPDQRYPVIERAEGMIKRVRWNNDDRGVIPFDGVVEPREWYEAARRWVGVLTREDMEYWQLLKPGTTLIFDNWRVLHGRSAFTGNRRVCGGYINRDDFISRWRNTNYTRSEILSHIIG